VPYCSAVGSYGSYHQGECPILHLSTEFQNVPHVLFVTFSSSFFHISTLSKTGLILTVVLYQKIDSLRSFISMFTGKQTTTILFGLTAGLSELYAVNLTWSEGHSYLLRLIQTVWIPHGITINISELLFHHPIPQQR
jgi:hypothetical protein